MFLQRTTMFLRRQHAVGQGAFHSGAILSGGRRFNYVYDCGSQNTSALKQCIANYRSVNPARRIDALVVSHLDADHVNGLDALLSEFTVVDVFLPYLTPLKRALLALIDSASGTRNAGLHDLFLDPVRWFNDRGVKRVCMITGRNEQDDRGNEGTPPQGVDAVRPSAKNERESNSLTLDVPGMRPSREGGPGSFEVADSVPLGVLDARGRAIWQFRTFVQVAPVCSLAFWNLVSRALQSSYDGNVLSRGCVHKLARALGTPKGRATLRGCYRSVMANLNRTSLMWYSGPVGKTRRWLVRTRGTSWTPYPPSRRCYSAARHSAAVGWLGTGDAELRAVRHLTALRQHFASVWQEVGSLALPHHGSSRNFAAGLLPPNARAFFISAGNRNRYHHPGTGVVAETARRGVTLVTTEGPRTEALEFGCAAFSGVACRHTLVQRNRESKRRWFVLPQRAGKRRGRPEAR